MKKSIQIIATAFAILLGNAGFSQNDTMYVNYGGNVTIAIPTSQIDSLTFYRPNSTPSITDADGNVYISVTIGAQEWMSENLRTSKYSDGTSIPNVTDDGDWKDIQWYGLETAAWCNYNNSSSNDASYGKLYNWFAVETGKLCPTGWHVPTDDEWTELTDYLTANGHSESEATALKSTSFGGTDDYGWLGLPGGLRSSSGSFGSNFGDYGYWWSSSQYSASYAWNRNFFNSIDTVYRNFGLKNSGFSVRCLKD